MVKSFAILLLVFATSVLAPNADAHKLSDVFMSIDPEQAQLSIALKDLDAAVEVLDSDEDRKVTYGELTQALPEVIRLLADDAAFLCDGVMSQSPWKFSAVERRNDGAYVRFSMAMPCASQAKIELRYRLLLAIDSSHRLLLTRRQMTAAGAEDISSVIASERLLALRQAGEINATSVSSWHNFLRFIPEGMVHIATGWDHLAFVLALLLPISLWRVATPNLTPTLHRRALIKLAGVITAFTVGHSITLILATLKLVSVNGQWVEAFIAFTIAVSAMFNLLGTNEKSMKYSKFLVLLALTFGLIHGFGFSSVLSDMGVSGASQFASLAGFNLGIEMGQLICVALWLGVQFWLCRWRGYAQWVVQGGSWILLLGATVLTIYRASI
jgi:hypothetical protein